MIVFEFDDGQVMPLFDGGEDKSHNLDLARAVDAEGRRRLKAGLSDTGRVCLRTISSSEDDWLYTTLAA